MINMKNIQKWLINMKQKNIAEMLDIKKQNITTYINRIKQKAIKCI